VALKNVIGIDHAVVVVRDLDKAAENWKRLGPKVLGGLFCPSGTICGLAGALLANNTEFVSPASISWTRSDDLMVILGGWARCSARCWARSFCLVLEEFLSQITQDWALIMAPALSQVVLFGRGGIAGPLGRLQRLG